MTEGSGRRGALDGIKESRGSTHAGLWFDRYFDARGGNDAKRDLMEQTAQLGVPQAYRVFFDRYKAALLEQAGVRLAVAEVQGRMVIGTGDTGVAEVGITLHHTYGVPYLPGSALKGMAAAYAHQWLDGDGWRMGGEAYTIVFGSTDAAGYITFFDALYLPTSAKDDRPLARDVITSHHPDYYVGDDPQPPADWDSPNPVPFLTATGRYLIAVAGPDAWADTALRIIGMALRDIGIGAKTAAGYGRMRLLDMDGRPIALPDATGSAQTAADADRTASGPAVPSEPPQAAAFRRDVAQAQKNTLANLVPRLEQLEVDPPLKRELAELLEARVRELKMTTEGKSWYQRLQRLREE